MNDTVPGDSPPSMAATAAAHALAWLLALYPDLGILPAMQASPMT